MHMIDNTSDENNDVFLFFFLLLAPSMVGFLLKKTIAIIYGIAMSMYDDTFVQWSDHNVMMRNEDMKDMNMYQ